LNRGYGTSLAAVSCAALLIAGGTTACATARAAAPERSAQAGTPAPGKMPANASRVTARVLRHAVYPPGSIVARPPVRPTATVYSLTLEILSVDPGAPDATITAVPGTIEAFSYDPLSTELVGHEIQAVVALTGDTRATRWFITTIQAK
jgi:hypothetical protein